MAEQVTYRPKIAADAARFLLKFFAGFLAAMIATYLAHVGSFLSLMSFFGVFYLLDYWTPPRPTVSFGKWAIRIVLIVGYMVLGLGVIPNLLSRFLWAWLAYGASAFVLIVSAYWIPMVRETKRTSLLQTLIFATAFGVVFALFGPGYFSGR